MAATQGRLIAYTVREYEAKGEKKSWWTAIGTAKKNRDDSLTVYLDALPLDGRLIIRNEEPKGEASKNTLGGRP